MLQTSRFAHLYPHYQRLWHGLTFRSLELSSAACDLWLRGEEPVAFVDTPEFRKLADAGFLISDRRETESLALAVSHTRSHQFQNLYLLLSLSCNLSCSYCLFNSRQSQSLSRGTRFMTADVARDALALFAAETRENQKDAEGYWEQVTFYGGEPLLNAEVLKAAVKQVRELQETQSFSKSLRLVVNTNGTLIEQSFARYAAREGLEIQLSLDGPQEIHDAQRMDDKGHGTFQRVLQTLRLLRAQHANVLPMVTVTTASAPALPDLVHLLARQGITTYASSILMHTHGPADKDYGRTAGRSMLEAHRILQGYGGEGDLTVLEFLQRFKKRAVAPSSCGAGRKIAVFPDGEVHTCQALEQSGVTKVGELRLNRDSAAWRRWSQRTRFENAKCLACPVVGRCGGGCAASAYNAFGSIEGIDPNYCGVAKSIFDDWLEHQFDEGIIFQTENRCVGI